MLNKQVSNFSYLQVLTTEEFVILQVNDNYVNLMFMENNKESFHQLSSKEFHNCFYEKGTVFTLSANKINLCKKVPHLKLIYEQPNEIDFFEILEKQSESESNHFLICHKNTHGKFVLDLVDDKGSFKNKIEFDVGEEIVLLRTLSVYSRDKYYFLVGYKSWINQTEFISKWKVFFLDHFNLGNGQIKFSVILQ